MMDEIRVMIEQTNEKGVLSYLELRYPNLPNEVANMINLDICEAITKAARVWAAEKATRCGKS